MPDMVQKWKTKNESRCFHFKEREEFERPWIIALFAFILIAVTVIEFFVNGSHYSLTLNIIVFIFLFSWWLTIPEKYNKTVIEKTVHHLMDDILDSDAKAVGTEVEKSCMYYETKGTYGNIFGIWLLVLLKNGQVWEYPIVHHGSIKDGEGYYECKRKYAESNNQDRIHFIKHCVWKNFADIFQISDKAKLWLLICAIIAIGGIAFSSMYWIIMRLRWWIILLLAGYGLLYVLTEWSATIFPGRVMRIFENIVHIPIAITFSFMELVHPFIAIVGTYFFVVLPTFGIPAFLLICLSKCNIWIQRPETIIFIELALGSILCSTYSVAKWFIRRSPLKDWGNHEYEKHREQLAYYLVHPSNMVFLLYFIYFVFLAISGYQLIQFDRFLFSNRIDTSILKAFLVYIAYTNMRVKAKETEVDAKELLDRISRLFVRDR